MLIRKAEPGDAEAIAAIIVPTIREGTTYALDTDMDDAEALRYWMSSPQPASPRVTGGRCG
jgi:hypothetical protein